MAIPPKGFDRDELARIRQVRYETTGQWRFASDAALASESGIITDQYGNKLADPASNRLLRGQFTYNADTGRYTAKSEYQPVR